MSIFKRKDFDRRHPVPGGKAFYSHVRQFKFLGIVLYEWEAF